MRSIEALTQDALEKFKAEVTRTSDKIAYISDEKTQRYHDMALTDVEWWTNGFYPGLLWQLYVATGDELYKQSAEGVERKLDKAFERFVGLHHDVGFMWLPSAVANYRLTGNPASLARGLHAATILAGRYNVLGNYIRSWNDDHTGWIIIDGMMNINILHWATEYTKDPRFSAIANRHADTVLSTLLRENGSVAHIASLDPQSGAFITHLKGQGMAQESEWTRGQSWGIYGFTLAYEKTKNTTYLEAAKRVADHFLSEVKLWDYATPVDFLQSKDELRYDSSAGCCAASGLLELAQLTGNTLYQEGAYRLLDVTDRKFCDWNKEHDGLVDCGTLSYDERDYKKLIYADYFFLEALLKAQGKNFKLW